MENIKQYFDKWCTKKKLASKFNVQPYLLGNKPSGNFLCELTVEGYNTVAVGYAKTKKECQTMAARKFVKYLIMIGELEYWNVPLELETAPVRSEDPSIVKQATERFGSYQNYTAYMKGRVQSDMNDMRGEEVDQDAGRYGYWTLKNSKRRLFQFLNEYDIVANFKFRSVGDNLVTSTVCRMKFDIDPDKKYNESEGSKESEKEVDKQQSGKEGDKQQSDKEGDKQESDKEGDKQESDKEGDKQESEKEGDKKPEGKKESSKLIQIKVRECANTKELATQLCAREIVRQLFELGLVEECQNAVKNSRIKNWDDQPMNTLEDIDAHLQRCGFSSFADTNNRMPPDYNWQEDYNWKDDVELQAGLNDALKCIAEGRIYSQKVLDDVEEQVKKEEEEQRRIRELCRLELGDEYIQNNIGNASKPESILQQISDEESRRQISEYPRPGLAKKNEENASTYNITDGSFSILGRESIPKEYDQQKEEKRQQFLEKARHLLPEESSPSNQMQESRIADETQVVRSKAYNVSDGINSENNTLEQEHQVKCDPYLATDAGINNSSSGAPYSVKGNPFVADTPADTPNRQDQVQQEAASFVVPCSQANNNSQLLYGMDGTALAIVHTNSKEEYDAITQLGNKKLYLDGQPYLTTPTHSSGNYTLYLANESNNIFVTTSAVPTTTTTSSTTDNYEPLDINKSKEFVVQMPIEPVPSSLQSPSSMPLQITALASFPSLLKMTAAARNSRFALVETYPGAEYGQYNVPGTKKLISKGIKQNDVQYSPYLLEQNRQIQQYPEYVGSLLPVEKPKLLPRTDDPDYVLYNIDSKSVSEIKAQLNVIKIELNEQGRKQNTEHIFFENQHESILRALDQTDLDLFDQSDCRNSATAVVRSNNNSNKCEQTYGEIKSKVKEKSNQQNTTKCTQSNKNQRKNNDTRGRKNIRKPKMTKKDRKQLSYKESQNENISDDWTEVSEVDNEEADNTGVGGSFEQFFMAVPNSDAAIAAIANNIAPKANPRVYIIRATNEFSQGEDGSLQLVEKRELFYVENAQNLILNFNSTFQPKNSKVENTAIHKPEQFPALDYDAYIKSFSFKSKTDVHDKAAANQPDDEKHFIENKTEQDEDASDFFKFMQRHMSSSSSSLQHSAPSTSNVTAGISKLGMMTTAATSYSKPDADSGSNSSCTKKFGISVNVTSQEVDDQKNEQGSISTSYSTSQVKNNPLSPSRIPDKMNMNETEETDKTIKIIESFKHIFSSSLQSQDRSSNTIESSESKKVVKDLATEMNVQAATSQPNSNYNPLSNDKCLVTLISTTQNVSSDEVNQYNKKNATFIEQATSARPQTRRDIPNPTCSSTEVDNLKIPATTLHADNKAKTDFIKIINYFTIPQRVRKGGSSCPPESQDNSNTAGASKIVVPGLEPDMAEDNSDLIKNFGILNFTSQKIQQDTTPGASILRPLAVYSQANNNSSNATNVSENVSNIERPTKNETDRKTSEAGKFCSDSAE